MWSSSHQWKRCMSLWGSTFQASDIGPPHSSPFPRGPRCGRDLCLNHEHDTNALEYGRARRQKGLAITGFGCALSHPINKSGYPEADVLWRNHVVRPHWYAERSWRDAGWSGPCCLSVSSSGTRRVREQPLRWPQPCHVWLRHWETLSQTHLAEPLLNSRLTETLRD